MIRKTFRLYPCAQGLLADFGSSWGGDGSDNFRAVLPGEGSVLTRCNATDLYFFQVPNDFPVVGEVLSVRIVSKARGYNSRFNHCFHLGEVAGDAKPKLIFTPRPQEFRLTSENSICSHEFTENPFTEKKWRLCEIPRIQAGPSIPVGVGFCSASPRVTRYVEEVSLLVEVAFGNGSENSGNCLVGTPA
jgi:hypothetical protein